jgi:CheY-like chemotaxis protein
MTANAFSEDMQHSLVAGMNAHISKPVDMKLLKKTIRNIKLGREEAQVIDQ